MKNEQLVTISEDKLEAVSGGGRGYGDHGGGGIVGGLIGGALGLVGGVVRGAVGIVGGLLGALFGGGKHSHY